MSIEPTKELIKNYLAGTCTAKEKAIVESWYQQNITNQPPVDVADPLKEREIIWSAIANGLNFESFPKTNTHVFFKSWKLAASLFIACSFIGYQFIWKPYLDLQSLNEIKAANILPFGSHAILKLADGKTIDLKNSALGSLIVDEEVSIRKTESGLISYSFQKSSSPKNKAYHTVTTQRGGQFQVILSDGTKVWLNAASSIQFPVSFAGNARIVELTGEAYFEVAKDLKKPFKVITNRQIIEVKGTHFNVNNYVNEPEVATTLLEGSVDVSDANHYQKVILFPGEQALFKKQNISVKKANTVQTIAWKSSTFDFNNESLGNIARKLERWYNIPVSVADEISEERFTGRISMMKDISQVLQIFRLTKLVHIKLEYFGENRKERRILIYQ